MTRPGEGAQSARGRTVSDIDRLATWLDARFRLPGTNLRFGFDSLVGLIPGIGDAATAVLGLYIVARAASLGAPRSLLARMVGNVLFDAAVGTLPVVGDAFDFAYKANLKNATLLKNFLDGAGGRS